jgi:hypothetical protein
LKRFTEWAGHAVKRTGWNLNPRAALSGLALVGGLALLAAFYLAISSQTAVLGRRLQQMEADRTEILRENAYLRDEIARSSSVFTLQQRALDAGYITDSMVIFIPVAIPGTE